MAGDLITVCTEVLGLPIEAAAQKLDAGWDVGVFGGCRTHVGAVTLAQPDGSLGTIEGPGHRERDITEPWAARLALALGEPICVRCGIHYDSPTREQIKEIVSACGLLLEKLLNLIT